MLCSFCSAVLSKFRRRESDHIGHRPFLFLFLSSPFFFFTFEEGKGKNRSQMVLFSLKQAQWGLSLVCRSLSFPLSVTAVVTESSHKQIQQGVCVCILRSIASLFTCMQCVYVCVYACMCACDCLDLKRRHIHTQNTQNTQAHTRSP